VLVKPSRADITTNLVITTDRRTYMLELRSGEKPYMPSVAWAYPQPPASSAQTACRRRRSSRPSPRATIAMA
jgi:type IV secretory pathway VirB9-like protein